MLIPPPPQSELPRNGKEEDLDQNKERWSCANIEIQYCRYFWNMKRDLGKRQKPRNNPLALTG